jgi:hypothetical protein
MCPIDTVKLSFSSPEAGWLLDDLRRYLELEPGSLGDVVTIAWSVRTTGIAAALAAPLLFAAVSFAQDMGMQVYSPGLPPSGQIIPAPVGHRQPRAADIPQTNRSPAEQLEDRQQAELNRKLRICRGC